MTLQRWHTIWEVFHGALPLDDSERAQFLDGAPGTDDLLGEVRSLLRFAGGFGPFDALVNRYAGPSQEVDEPAVGARIGPYRVLRKIGQGGMGVVYLAERADGQFEQRVALKLIRRGAGVGPLLHRFLNERAILARLVHPNIARLYGGGFLPPLDGEPGDGRPYFVMEHVQGMPIDRYCEAHQLGVDDRLKLFCQMCAAVSFAHRNLVVHRDLKPSNILVSENGEVKLLDFGVAKLLETASDAGSTLTRIGIGPMTPAYASPEQIRPRPITTATDVYSLGVVLYELLSGHRPYEVEAASAVELERVVCDVEPRRPSQMVGRSGTAPSGSLRLDPFGRAQAEKLARRLAGDLDTIVMKALRKEPERRYASAEQLLEDVQRHLSGVPVLARPNTPSYRLSKFVRRHRVAVAAACLVVLTLVGGIIGTIWQAKVAAAERDQARVAADKAEQVAAFLEDLFNSSDPLLAAETERPDTLRLHDFISRGAEKVRRELTDQPDVQASMLNVVGDVHRSLGLYEEARPLLEEALQIRRDARGSNHPEVAESLHSLAAVLHRMGDYGPAEDHFQEAISIRRRTRGGDDVATARMLVDFALLRRDLGRFDEAEHLLREALEIQRNQFASEHIDVATTLMHLGTVFQYRSDLDGAEAFYVEALGIHRRLLSEGHPTLAESLLNMGTFLREKGDLEAAERHVQEALNVRRRVLGEEHPLTVTATYELAMLLREKADYAQAVALFRGIIDLDRAQLGPDHPYVAMDFFELGVTLNRMQDYVGAEEAYKEALTIVRSALPPDHPTAANVLNGLGYNYVDKGAPAEGEPMLREALRIFREIVDDAGWRTGMAQSALGHALMAQGRLEEAEPLLLDGYATLRENGGPTRASLERLVQFYEMREAPDLAAQYEALLAEAAH